MSVFVIACVTINQDEKDAYQTYVDTTTPLLERAGAKITQHFPVDDVVIGEKPAENVMVVQYPDIEAVHNLFDSPEYRAVIPYRDRAFTTYSVSIVG